MLTNEQLNAINHDSGNFIVSASAGSGKTFVMIERAVRLVLENKATVNELLLVTFTESAAAEMKEKLKKELSKRISGGRKDIAHQLADVDTADVSTLHSFCTRLLRKYFYGAGVSPDFSVIDALTASVYKKESIEKTFLSLYKENESWFNNIIDKYRVKRKDGDFKDIILSMYDFMQIEARPSQLKERNLEFLSLENFDNILKIYKEQIDKKLKILIEKLEWAKRIFTLEEKPKLILNADELLEQANILLTAENVYGVKKLKDKFLDLSREKGKGVDFARAKKYLKIVKGELSGIISRLNAHLCDYQTDLNRQKEIYADLESVYKIIELFSQNYSNIKKEENCLDFNDLEHLALKILDNDEYLSDIKNKYKFIFIDEYQDTNDVQEEIITKISNDNLFMVGDVKQSIYAFRGCNPDIFENKFNQMESANPSSVTRLNKNFRSAKAVVDIVNQIFNYSMTEKVYGVNYQDNSQLIYGELSNGYDGRAELHYYDTASGEEKKIKESLEPDVYDISKDFNILEQEDIEGVSCMIAEIIKKELGKTYYDTKEKKEKAITYADIVLLSRTNVGRDIAPIVKGLIKQGVPVVSAINENVCDYAEVQLLISALKLIDCFKQDVPLVSVMKSPIGNFTEEELMQIVSVYREGVKRQDNPCFYKAVLSASKLEIPQSLKQKVAGFLEFFDRVRSIADFVGAKEILQKLIDKCDLENVLLAGEDGELKVKRIRKFLSEGENGGIKLTVSAFLKKIESSPRGFELSVEPKENTVRVMTVHASKGLEFPVVILCGLEAKRKAYAQKTYAKSLKYGFAFNYYDQNSKIIYPSILSGIIREESLEQELKEELRLFYVATTRAQYALHLAYKGSQDYLNDLAEFYGGERFIEFVPVSVLDSNARTVYTDQDFVLSRAKNRVKKVFIGKYLDKDAEMLKERYSYIYPYMADTELPLKTTVTELNAHKELTDELPVAVTLYKEKTDTESGTIAHKILEHLDFSNIDYGAQIAKMVLGGVLSDKELEKINLDRLLKAIDCEEIKNLSSKKIYKEQQFIISAPANIFLGAQTSESVLVQGIIDLLVIDENGASVIDYKYSNADKNALTYRYKGQLDIYAYAVEKSLKLKVNKKLIINILTGERVEII